MEGVWIRRGAGATVLVFVHGILSDSDACWRHPDGAWWPGLVRDDPRLSDVSIYVFRYRTGVFTGSYSISDIVDSLKEHLRLDGVIGYKRMVFVCHSMGGIVARRYLVSRQSELIEQAHEIGLFLAASPSLGSKYANLASEWARNLGLAHAQAEGLRFIDANPWLADLDKDFKNLKESGRLLIRGKELVEERFLVLSRFFRKSVVEPFSGAVYFGEPYKVPDSDHSSIAKPASAAAIQHRLLADFVLSFSSGGAARPPAEVAPSASAEAVQQPEPEPKPEPQPASPGALPPQHSLPELLQRLCSLDPLVAMPAAEEIAQSAESFQEVIDRPQRSNEPVPLAAARRALRARPEAAECLARRVLQSDRSWREGLAASEDFDVSHRPHAAAMLGTALADSGRDRRRHIYRSLGNLGAVEWSWTVLHDFEGLDQDEAESCAISAVLGATEMFRHARGRDEVEQAGTVLMRLLELDLQRKTGGYSPLSVRYALGWPTGDHASVLIERFAKSKTPLLREIAADALGDGRIARAQPVLEHLLRDEAREVRISASQALGSMQSREALGRLLKAAPDSDGVTFSLHLLDDDAEFDRLADDHLVDCGLFCWAAVRAVGLRRAARHAPRLRALLHADGEMVRGAALLALARIGDPSDRSRIEDGVAESSSSSFESAMAILACLLHTPARYQELEPALRTALAGSHYLWPLAQADVVELLEGFGRPDATRLADAWRPFYKGMRPRRSAAAG